MSWHAIKKLKSGTMGVQKRRRLAKTTRQAVRVKRSNTRRKTNKEIKVPLSVWDQKKSLRQNYAKMGLLPSFDSKLDQEGRIQSTRGVRGNTQESEGKYETVGQGFFAKKRREEREKKENPVRYVEQLEQRAKNPREKKLKFNVSMEEIQTIERILAKFGLNADQIEDERQEPDALLRLKFDTKLNSFLWTPKQFLKKYDTYLKWKEHRNL